ncbi:uncharacterized protein LOC117565672 [Drosophila albomicans]|uniref:Uncharacterized protein LOC117565672 n=1 Tax=Drosophila albomicans TaxID=7291 RepID=A0A6P8WRG1_DROAB|nr:uncharacterized protein LOC117565672 [Drosophila albomicans]
MEIVELNEPGTVEEEDALWSIEDDTLFQPCGLISHSSTSNNKTKSVFVTWNECYLINYRFKTSKKTNRMEMTKVRIPLPNNNCYLRSIHMLEYNTLLLMSDGRVHCFGSIKSLHSIAWLKGVRAFAQTHEGFSVIAHNEETQQLLLQVYMDLPSLGKGESTLLQSYDITYDEQNIFQCDWQNDHYTLMTVTVTKSHEKFMQCLFGVGAIADKQLHIFSIAGHVFVLIPYDANEDADKEQAYNIELLCIYATSVDFMRLLPSLNLCLVYLSCGSVDIWYMSQLLGIKQRQMHFTGAEWLDYDASSDNGDFYYTDGEQLVRLRFQYDEQLDDCVVQRCCKSVAGMQACTWVQHIEQLVCLSDNNIFYRIAFSLQQEQQASRDDGMLNDLTPAAVERLRGNADVLEQYEQQPAQLLAAIQREHEKQQLVAVARNEAWEEQSLEATLEFRRQLPVYGIDMLLLHTARQVDLDSCGVYATLLLKLHNSHLLLHSSHWQILVYHEHEAHVHRVPTDLLISRKCRIIIPLKRIHNTQLPVFTLKLVAFLEFKTQINAVLLPVEVKETSETYRALFNGHLYSLNLFSKPQAIDLLRSADKKAKPIIKQKIKPFSNMNLQQIASLCNASDKSHDNNLDLYFVDSKLSLTSSQEENNVALLLESDDASALYHFKQHLYLNLEPEDEDLTPIEDIQLKVMKLQHDIERLYSSQNAEDFEENTQIHLEALLLKYKTLRNTIF